MPILVVYNLHVGYDYMDCILKDVYMQKDFIWENTKLEIS